MQQFFHRFSCSVTNEAQEQLFRKKAEAPSAAEYLEGEAVVSVDRSKKIVTLEDGRKIRYSKLVLAVSRLSQHGWLHVLDTRF